ncbi:MAG TPA: CHAT domain-containing protein, partial [Thermoanaerobaculia bacterium]|nr:CHAT domain-containing protein [Thermoanaerobaculia bacterium]
VLADPVFQPDDARVASTPGPAESRAALLSTDLTRAASEAGLDDFPRLAWTRREAEAAVRQAGGRPVLLALDFDASLETVRRPDLSHFRVLHFATHGVINDRHPELSGLVLSLVDGAGRPRDGFLRLPDIFNLDLGADLVVLSGCKTALGREVRGEGLMGLTRGFFYAGASRVLATLWPVRDRATAELMERFYRSHLRDGLSPAEALRAAQLSLRRDPRWRDPYFWAPFVLQGDWKADSPAIVPVLPPLKR